MRTFESLPFESLLRLGYDSHHHVIFVPIQLDKDIILGTTEERRSLAVLALAHAHQADGREIGDAGIEILLVLNTTYLRRPNKCQNRPTIGAKETYDRGKRDLL